MIETEMASIFYQMNYSANGHSLLKKQICAADNLQIFMMKHLQIKEVERKLKGSREMENRLIDKQWA